jgi:excisionase family DNA binding protein
MTTLPDTEPVFTIIEASDALRLHPETIRRMINDGRLEAFKVAGRWRIRREALESLVTETRTAP